MSALLAPLVPIGIFPALEGPLTGAGTVGDVPRVGAIATAPGGRTRAVDGLQSR